MKTLCPDNVKISKRILQDMLENGVGEVLKYQGEDILKDCLREVIDYISELERLPGNIQDYLDARKELDRSLDYLKEKCKDNHR